MGGYAEAHAQWKRYHTRARLHTVARTHAHTRKDRHTHTAEKAAITRAFGTTKTPRDFRRAALMTGQVLFRFEFVFGPAPKRSPHDSLTEQLNPHPRALPHCERRAPSLDEEGTKEKKTKESRGGKGGR